MPTNPRSMIIVVVAIVAIVTVAFVVSANDPPIEHQPTPTALEREGRRLRDFDVLPEYDKLRVSEDVGVYYLRCDPPAVWDPISSVLIFHFPSGSWYSPVSLGPDTSQVHYVSDEGRRALQAVRADEALMETILERSPKPVRCPEGLAVGLPDYMQSWPVYDFLRFDDEIVVKFNDCGGHVEYDGIFQIYHGPSWSAVEVEVNPGSFQVGLGTTEYVAAPSAKRRLQQILEDEALIADLRAASDRSVRCPAPGPEELNGAPD